MRNGWWFTYSSSTDTSQWNNSGNLRFLYQYGVGRWYDEGKTGGWQTLGPAGLSTSFLGDGNTHDLGNGGTIINWSYSFSGGAGLWTNTSLNLSQFKYNYGASQWSHAGRTWGFVDLGPMAMSASFLGDGNWYSFSSNLWYMYNYLVSVGYEKDSNQNPWEAFTY
jgi:hypothetical protein